MGLTAWVGGEVLPSRPASSDHLPGERCWQDLGWGGGQCAASGQSGGQGGAHHSQGLALEPGERGEMGHGPGAGQLGGHWSLS